jgi:hypothetical protein
MTYPGHSQAAQFQQAITAQAPTQASVTPAFHNGIGAHPDFQNMPQYAASSTAAYHDQQSHASFVSSAPPVSSAAADFHGAPRSLAPPAYNPNIGSAHFMPGQPQQAHTQPMGYREGTTQHAYGYDAWWAILNFWTHLPRFGSDVAWKRCPRLATVNGSWLRRKGPDARPLLLNADIATTEKQSSNRIHVSFETISIFDSVNDMTW